MNRADPQINWPSAEAVAHDAWTAKNLLFWLKAVNDRVCPEDVKTDFAQSGQLWSDGRPGQRDQDRIVAMVVPRSYAPSRLVVIAKRQNQRFYQQLRPTAGGGFTFHTSDSLEDGLPTLNLYSEVLPTEADLRRWGFHPDLSAPASAWLPGEYHWSPARITTQTRVGKAAQILGLLAVGAWCLTGHLDPYLPAFYDGFGPLPGVFLTMMGLFLILYLFGDRPTQATPHARYLGQLQELMAGDLLAQAGLYEPGAGASVPAPGVDALPDLQPLLAQTRRRVWALSALIPSVFLAGLSFSWVLPPVTVSWPLIFAGLLLLAAGAGLVSLYASVQARGMTVTDLKENVRSFLAPSLRTLLFTAMLLQAVRSVLSHLEGGPTPVQFLLLCLILPAGLVLMLTRPLSALFFDRTQVRPPRSGQALQT